MIDGKSARQESLNNIVFKVVINLGEMNQEITLARPIKRFLKDMWCRK